MNPMSKSIVLSLCFQKNKKLVNGIFEKVQINETFFSNVFAMDTISELKDSFFFFSKTTNKENELILYDTLLHVTNTCFSIIYVIYSRTTANERDKPGCKQKICAIR
jgi:hypothetical protein